MGDFVHSAPDRNIRVLSLYPGGWDDEIRCKLHVVNVDDPNISYEALSYVWGAPQEGRPVRVSGEIIIVTPSLYNALRHLRRETGKRTLWIDQLCINQWDKNEKANQVSLMRDIYRKCLRCIIWLGEITDSSGISHQDAKDVFSFIKSVVRADVCPVPAPDETLKRSTSHEHKGMPGGIPTIFQENAVGERVRRAFAAFVMYGNPWWSRIWTVQEAVLPDSAHLCWGPLVISRNDVFTFVRYMKRSPYGAMDCFPLAFQSQRWKYFELFRWLSFPVLGFVRSLKGEEPLDLLMRWRHRHAIDPRDKIYALLGLLPDGTLPSARPCSYSISTRDLFIQVTIDVIKHECSLRPLIASREMVHQTKDLPTWAIDFACSNRVGKRQLKWFNHSYRYFKFSACRNNDLTFYLSTDQSALHLKGVYIDRIAKINGVYEVPDDEHLDRARLWNILSTSEALFRSHLATQPSEVAYVNGDAWEEAFMRTMLGGLIMDELPVERANSSHAYAYKQAKSCLAHGIECSMVVMESLESMLANHAFFITEKGYIGIGPPQTTPGDQVWVFYGGQVPFVTRGVEGGEQITMNLVGDAYVHGVMDGEALGERHRASEICIY